ncbi:hypothetical protein PUN28_000446 [Cardiocondyla obscurior]|uniref:Uncharacterized protein n=1 Tax=Cardiocondyla obscurior TaxID=286306 RepID=A0AAW2GZV1_9HYME
MRKQAVEEITLARPHDYEWPKVLRAITFSASKLSRSIGGNRLDRQPGVVSLTRAIFRSNLYEPPGFYLRKTPVMKYCPRIARARRMPFSIVAERERIPRKRSGVSPCARCISIRSSITLVDIITKIYIIKGA